MDRGPGKATGGTLEDVEGKVAGKLRGGEGDQEAAPGPEEGAGAGREDQRRLQKWPGAVRLRKEGASGSNSGSVFLCRTQREGRGEKNQESKEGRQTDGRKRKARAQAGSKRRRGHETGFGWQSTGK